MFCVCKCLLICYWDQESCVLVYVLGGIGVCGVVCMCVGLHSCVLEGYVDS